MKKLEERRPGKEFFRWSGSIILDFAPDDTRDRQSTNHSVVNLLPGMVGFGVTKPYGINTPALIGCTVCPVYKVPRNSQA